MKTKLLRWIICFVLFLLTLNSAFAETKATHRLNLNEFKQIIIVEQGRLKPLDTYARNLALKFSGRSKVEGQDAIYWLAEILFNPEDTYETKIFLINNPEVLEAIGVKPSSHRRYSFKELELGIVKLHEYAAKSFQKEDKERTPIEKEFLRVFNNFHHYVQLVNSLQFNAIHSDFQVEHAETRAKLSLKTNGNSLFQIIQRSDELEVFMSKFSSVPANQLAEGDRDIVRLAFNLYKWIENHRAYTDTFGLEDKLAIAPVKLSEDSSVEWISPWDLLLKPQVTYKQELFDLNIMYKAYRAADQVAFDNIVREFKVDVNKKLLKYGVKPPKINTELLYNLMNPFVNAKFFYGFAFLSMILGTLVLVGWFRQLSLVLVSAGFLFHTTGLLLRMLILERAPVSNLFETFIFVSWITVLLGLILWFLNRSSSIGLLLAAFSGFLLLLISGKFGADGDTMQVLIAVLNSNFWLSTHVICVTVGYAGVFAAGLVGHLYLMRSMLNTQNKPEIINDLRQIHKMILGILGFGLCFSFLGTMLGGIWADQSWGRFWGWDPKENGALLIVLWSVIIFHARMAGLIRERGIAIASVFGCVVVMTSWFGINLLGVGLHSYGFTQGIAAWLYGFYIFEFVFMIVALSYQQSKVTSQV